MYFTLLLSHKAEFFSLLLPGVRDVAAKFGDREQGQLGAVDNGFLNVCGKVGQAQNASDIGNLVFLFYTKKR